MVPVVSIMILACSINVHVHYTTLTAVALFVTMHILLGLEGIVGSTMVKVMAETADE